MKLLGIVCIISEEEEEALQGRQVKFLLLDFGFNCGLIKLCTCEGSNPKCKSVYSERGEKAIVVSSSPLLHQHQERI